jgi:HAD superfamily hydrolase (TIGR01459 family)
MSAPQILAGLSQIADRYDAILCDVWGVLHNGVERFPAACEALERFQAERGPVVLISNSPRPSADVVAQLHALGVPDAAWTRFVSSGDVTRALLAERAPGPAWDIGPDRDDTLYKGLGLTLVDGPEAAAFISCTGLVDDETETPEDYRDALQVAVRRGLQMICANPDIVVQRGERLIFCGGALAALYEELGGAAIMAGKPHAPIYQASLAAADALVPGLDHARVLCIGDGMGTDVLGANQHDLDCLFIAEGIHAADTADHQGLLQADRLEAFLAKQRLHAAYALAALVW